MGKSVGPSEIKGEVISPSSKSMMQRVVAAALLAEGESTRILNPSFCRDSLAALGVAEGLGAEVAREENAVLVKGGLKPSAKMLHCGEAGLCLRMFAPIAALCAEELVLSGEGSLLKRPVSMIEAPLRELGARCSTNEGYLPLRVKGPLQGGSARVDGSVSSQLLTGLLLALPRVKRNSELRVKNLKSIPYVDLTLELLRQCHVRIEHEDYATFSIEGNQQYKIGSYTVEGDWSGASFILVAAALAGSVRVSGLDMCSPQADRKILEVLESAGAKVKTSGDTVEIDKDRLQAFECDATDCPDLFPPLAALACYCRGTSLLRGVERLRHKESDRAGALAEEFGKLGGDIRVRDNVMEVRGVKLTGGVIDSHNDHRIAMAAAVAALDAEGEVIIEGHRCVAKSYPRFFDDLAALGGRVYE